MNVISVVNTSLYIVAMERNTSDGEIVCSEVLIYLCFREQPNPSDPHLCWWWASLSFPSMKSSSLPWLRLSSPWWGAQAQKVAARVWNRWNQEVQALVGIPQASTTGVMQLLLTAALKTVRCKRASRSCYLYFPGIASCTRRAIITRAVLVAARVVRPKLRLM